jgi:hypothetical protein
MTTMSATDHAEDAAKTQRSVEDDINAELFSSDREAGVACFAAPDDGFDEDDD